MSGRRLVAILIGLVGIIVLIAAIFLLVFQGGDGEEDVVEEVVEAPAEEVDGTPVPPVTPSPTIDPNVVMVEVVVSLQTVPRGWQMTEAELTTDLRLASEVASNVLTNIGDGIGLYARQDIYQGETLTTDTLVGDPRLIGTENYGPSSLVPPGWVAMAIPTDRLASVAYGVKPGDVIDIMLTFTLSAIDQEFQTLLNNSATFFLQESVSGGSEEGAVSASIFVIDPYGRFEQVATGDLAHIAPSEDTQRPVPVSVILQAGRVIEVGAYQPPLPAMPPTPTPDPDAATPTPSGAQATATPAPPDVVLIALPPQQQLFLKYAVETDADIDLALRGVNDAQLYSVQQVDILYLLEQFNIVVPPDANFTIGGLEKTSLEAGDVEVEEP
jgi:pilus assembly protein CpaB